MVPLPGGTGAPSAGADAAPPAPGAAVSTCADRSGPIAAVLAAAGW
jgi:hypothetical protein